MSTENRPSTQPIHVGDDATLLQEANAAQNPDLQYTSPLVAELLQGPDYVRRGEILGKVIFPMSSKDNSAQVSKSEKLDGPLLTKRVKRFAVVASQEAPELTRVFRFIPIHDLPNNQDAGSLKTLSFYKVIEMLEQAGANAESISGALQLIPDSVVWSAVRSWQDRGGHPHRRGSMKRRPSSFHFGATPAAIEKKHQR